MPILTKVAPLRVKAAGDSGEFEGYGSIFNVVDSVGDVVMPGAYTATLERHAADGTRPKGLWQHDPSRPILSWLEMREDDKGLWCRGRLILDVQQAREAHALMKAGELDGLSIGFECTEAEYVRPDDFQAKFGYGLAPMPYPMAPGTQVRALRAIDLWEVSLVTFPACAPARLTAVKTAPRPFVPAVSAAMAALAHHRRLLRPLA